MQSAAVHPAALDAQQLLAECQVRHTRRSGPGGQHRNKVETAVVIVHVPTGVKAEANERRSQRENHRQAVFRLRMKLALEIRRPPADSAPSPLWKSRCRGGQVAISPTHDDFPRLLAEALDVLASYQMSVPAAAKVLACSATQLVKLLKLEPAALKQVNDARAAAGLHALK